MSPLRKKILPDSPSPDGERPRLGAHLHELEDVGKTELLQVALQKHRTPLSHPLRRLRAAFCTLHRQPRRFSILRQSIALGPPPARPTGLIGVAAALQVGRDRLRGSRPEDL